MKKRTPNRSERPPKMRVPACPRVPVCLLDQRRGGVPISIEERGGKFALIGLDPGRALSTRKRREAAEQLLSDVDDELSRASGVSPELLAERRETTIVTPQRPKGEAAHYEVIERTRLIPSNDPITFYPDPRYPEGVQERDYRTDKGEQDKVIKNGQTLNPSIVLSDVPSPADGPPIATTGPQRFVLGGNSRAMSISRAYIDGAKGALYKTDLLKRAVDFGIDRSIVQSMDAPVLIRVVDGISSDAPKSELVAAVRRYNENQTQKLSPRALAIAQAKTLTPGTIEALGELLSASGDASLRMVLTESPRAVVEILSRDGVITPTNRAEFVVTNGSALTDQGKDTIEGAFLGRVIGSGERFAATAPSILAKVERAAAPLIRVAGVNPGYDLIPTVQKGLDLVNQAHGAGYSVAQLLQQEQLFKTDREAKSPDVVRMAELLDTVGQRSIGERFRAWARLAGFNPNQRTLLGTPNPTRAEAEAKLFDGLRTPNPEAPFVVEADPRKMRDIVRALREQFGDMPATGKVIVSGRGAIALLAFKGKAVTRFELNGKNSPPAARALTHECGCDARATNPKKKTKPEKLPPPSPLVTSLGYALAAKWKAENANDTANAARLQKRVKDLERGVQAEGRDRIGQAFRLAHGYARRAGIEVGK